MKAFFQGSQGTTRRGDVEHLELTQTLKLESRQFAKGSPKTWEISKLLILG
jgi:hypothetical protein